VPNSELPVNRPQSAASKNGGLTTTIDHPCRGCSAIMFGVSDMGLLANFKIRTKIIIALLPLTIMVIVAVLYSSDRMSTIDAGYSGLIDKDINALQDLTFAQSLNNLFGQILYKEIVEANSDSMRRHASRILKSWQRRDGGGGLG
jgi:hypothetical protein